MSNPARIDELARPANDGPAALRNVSGLNGATPEALHQQIAATLSIEELRGVQLRMLEMVRSAAGTGTHIRNIVRLISQLNDSVLQRLIILLANLEDIRLPPGAAYLALGSEGRGEQTLRTDQDSAIVYCDGLSPDQLLQVERFAHRLVEALQEIGIPRCPGGIMASNPRWRNSLSGWRELLDAWITSPTPEHMLDFGIFQGLRVLHGDQMLEKQIHLHIQSTVRRTTLFFPCLARHALRFPPPFTVFGRIRVEPAGEHRGTIDIKKTGLFALTVGVSLLALENGFIGGSTWEKLEKLGERGVLAPGDLAIIEEAFTFLVGFRLQWQMRRLASGGKPTDHIDPLALSGPERSQLRKALKGINLFLRLMTNRYQLNFISR